MYKSEKGGSGKSYSKSQHSFAVSIPTVTRERSTIDRPSRTMMAGDAAWLYPCLVDEVLPGDTFQMSTQVKAWLATPLKPFLDNLYLNTFFFFVPNRLVWDNWQKFQGEQANPGDSVSFTVPQLEFAGGASGVNKLADYMGLPTIATTKEVNALPFRGYNLIYNEFFRDQNLQNSVTLDKGDANSLEANHVLLKRGKRKDYITGALPWPQKPGDGLTPGVISGVVPVQSTEVPILFQDNSGNESTLQSTSGSGALVHQTSSPDILSAEPIEFGSVTGLEADLDSAQANTINQLRQSIAIQQLLELDARSGTRYTEQLKARFGVTSPDFRLQRPEYLGGGQVNISVSPVPGTNQAAGALPPGVGTLGAFGGAAGNGGGFTHSFTEHGYVIGLVSLRSDLSYSEGIPRHWSRLTRYDYAEPALMHLGEQPVYNQEVFVSNVDADDFGPLGVWGYQERFGEYKYGNSMITGIMRPNIVGNLAQWHLGEEFVTAPTLNAAFIVDNPPVDRVIAVTSEPHVLMDLYFANRCTRVMPVFNTPGLTRL